MIIVVTGENYMRASKNRTEHGSGSARRCSPPRYYFDFVSNSSLWPNHAAVTADSSDQIHLCLLMLIWSILDVMAVKVWYRSTEEKVWKSTRHAVFADCSCVLSLVIQTIWGKWARSTRTDFRGQENHRYKLQKRRPFPLHSRPVLDSLTGDRSTSH